MPGKFKYGPPKEVVCPECLECFPLWDMKFSEPDEFRGNRVTAVPSFRTRLQSGLSKLHVPGVSRPYPKYGLSDKGHKLIGKFCPNEKCQSRLPQTAGEEPTIIIGVLGTEYSGKSTYVAALVTWLIRESSLIFNWSISAADIETHEKYMREYYNPLFKDMIRLQNTFPWKSPLLYSLSLRSRTGKKHQIKSITLVFYDTAGEHFNSTQHMGCTQYLRQASGIIFLIDPLQSQIVRQMVSCGTHISRYYRNEVAPAVVLGRIIQTIRTQRGVGANSPIDIPIAISLSKADVLHDEGLVDRGGRWAQGGCHKDYYDLSLHQDINTTFSSLMKEWDEAVWNILTTNFINYAFFGVSSTGCSADEEFQGGKYEFIVPLRVEEPLLWLLYKLGVIDGKSG